MIDDQDDVALTGRITLDQLLLAASVLSAQNPQGANFDRKKLLEDAYEFAQEASSAAFEIPFFKKSRRDEWMRLFVKFGYDQREELEFVPYKQAAIEITGIATEKQAVKRFAKLIEGSSDLRELTDLIQRHGVWKDCIDDLSRRDKEISNLRSKLQNAANAALPRDRKKKSTKVLDRPRPD
jgi:hypothetical protein